MRRSLIPIAACSWHRRLRSVLASTGFRATSRTRFALRSQQRAAAAWNECRFKDEVVPVEIKTRKGVTVVDRDDHLRPDTTLEGLAKLPTAFSKDGTVTAGNASGIVDGGAALMLASDKAVQREGSEADGAAGGVGRRWASIRRSWAWGRRPPPGKRSIAPGLKLADLDLIEVNEAFAGQYLAVEKELGLDREKVNVNGGAIALGHPLGMSGTRLLLTVTNELRRTRQALSDWRRRALAVGRASPPSWRRCKWRSRRWACWAAA